MIDVQAAESFRWPSRPEALVLADRAVPLLDRYGTPLEAASDVRDLIAWRFELLQHVRLEFPSQESPEAEAAASSIDSRGP